MINTAQTSNGGDGDVGSDSTEGVAWSPELQARQDEMLNILRANAAAILMDLRESETQEGSIPPYQEGNF